ncbi:hypothetical protein [Stygiolobus caldivivus]|uniref:Uncharacterized protein n=1 Tax=Stygiolobus caldivivus TaxID=2824673 RepID=A0A8D5U5V1_9CREN|nr:hypothetical protein [Stygiolobus caldivivus]BCU70061.1 hypothetical protein KN1_13580 [Stygiolobus caldivivus]
MSDRDKEDKATTSQADSGKEPLALETESNGVYLKEKLKELEKLCHGQEYDEDFIRELKKISIELLVFYRNKRDIINEFKRSCFEKLKREYDAWKSLASILRYQKEYIDTFPFEEEDLKIISNNYLPHFINILNEIYNKSSNEGLFYAVLDYYKRLEAASFLPVLIEILNADKLLPIYFNFLTERDYKIRRNAWEAVKELVNNNIISKDKITRYLNYLLELILNEKNENLIEILNTIFVKEEGDVDWLVTYIDNTISPKILFSLLYNANDAVRLRAWYWISEFIKRGLIPVEDLLHY